MELRHIRYFLAVAEELNFSRAAARLGVGQPPVSVQIRDLENELGAPLFHRVPRGAELTEAGEAFLVEARSIIAGVERATLAAQRAHRGRSGRISVGFTGSAVFHPLVTATIRKFRESWPDASLTFFELNTMMIVDRLRRQELDAAFIRPALEDLDGLRLHHMAPEAIMIAFPSRHRLARAKSVRLKDLAQEPFILTPPAEGLSLYHEVVVACRSNGFDPIVGQIVPQISSALSLVAAELGIAPVPASNAKIRVPGITFRPIEGTAPIARLALATRRESGQVVLRNFVKALKDVTADSNL